MMLLRKTLGLVVLLFCSFSLAENQNTTDNPAPHSFNLAEVTCWDGVTFDEQQRGALLFLLSGYVFGVKTKPNHDGESIQTTLSTLGKYCADNPDDVVLKVVLN